MWTINKNIAKVMSERRGDLPACGLVVHIPDFERFYFEQKIEKDKPYYAMSMLSSHNFQKTEPYDLLKNFVSAALENKHPGSYDDYESLTEIVQAWRDKKNPSPPEEWEYEMHE